MEVSECGFESGAFDFGNAGFFLHPVPLIQTAVTYGMDLPALSLKCYPAAVNTYTKRPKTRIYQSDSIKPDRLFGMRLRKVPSKTREVFMPVALSQSPADGATVLRMPVLIPLKYFT